MQMPESNTLNLLNAETAEHSITQMVKQAVDSVFSTMLSSKAELLDSSNTSPGEKKPPPLSYFGENHSVIVGIVGFVGNLNGAVYLYLDEELARKLIGKMLGMEHEEVKQEGMETVNDALGEICNMTVGSFKQQLCSGEEDCRLTIPSIVHGSNFSIETSANVIRLTCPFQTEGEPFIIDVLLNAQ